MLIGHRACTELCFKCDTLPGRGQANAANTLGLASSLGFTGRYKSSKLHYHHPVALSHTGKCQIKVENIPRGGRHGG